MRAPLLFLAAALSLAFAPVPFPRRARPEVKGDDLKLLQGTWEMIRRTRGGRAVNHVVHSAEVSGLRFTLVNAAGSWRSPFSLTLDPTKTPRHFDMKSENGTYSTCGIYEIRGDTLRLCYVANAARRPSSFDGAAPGVYLDLYRRRKP